MSSNEPLWKMIDSAAMEAQRKGRDGRLSYGAEIRAIAGEMGEVFDLTGDAGRVFEWLLAEADRAEQSNA